jgi:hypothetical protein
MYRYIENVQTLARQLKLWWAGPLWWKPLLALPTGLDMKLSRANLEAEHRMHVPH